MFFSAYDVSLGLFLGLYWCLYTWWNRHTLWLSPVHCAIKQPFQVAAVQKGYKECGTLILVQTSLHLCVVSRPVVESARTVSVKDMDMYSNTGCCFGSFFLQWFGDSVVCTFNAAITFGFILFLQFGVESLTLKFIYVLFYV